MGDVLDKHYDSGSPDVSDRRRAASARALSTCGIPGFRDFHDYLWISIATRASLALVQGIIKVGADPGH
jgi:hypothetical protein